MFWGNSGLSSWPWFRPHNPEKLPVWCNFPSSQGLNVVFTLVWACCCTHRWFSVILWFSLAQPRTCRHYPQGQQCYFQMNLLPEWINKPGCISGRDTKEVNDREDRDWHPQCSGLIPCAPALNIWNVNRKLIVWTDDSGTVWKWTLCLKKKVYFRLN